MSVAVATDWRPLDEADLRRYHEQGFLLLRGVFDAAEVERGLALVAECERAGNQERRHASHIERSHTLRVRNAVASHPGLAYFLDHPGLVGPLVSVLTPSVQILGTEVFVRSLQDGPLEYWHTDGGPHLQRIQLADGSQSLQVKMQVFLTDTTEPGCGNFVLLPGSHRRLPESADPQCFIESLNEPLDRGELPDGAQLVAARPGDVLLFPFSLWHAVAQNTRRVRKTLIFRYGQLWHRPVDYLQQPPELLRQLSPRLRRMLGDFGDQPHPSDYYKPVDQDAVMSGGGVLSGAR